MLLLLLLLLLLSLSLSLSLLLLLLLLLLSFVELAGFLRVRYALCEKLDTEQPNRDTNMIFGQKLVFTKASKNFNHSLESEL